MQAQRGSKSGVPQGTDSNVAGIQTYGPYRQRKRVLIMPPMSPPAAERVPDNTML